MNENDRYGDPPNWWDGFIVIGMIAVIVLGIAIGSFLISRSDQKLQDQWKKIEQRMGP